MLFSNNAIGSLFCKSRKNCISVFGLHYFSYLTEGNIKVHEEKRFFIKIIYFHFHDFLTFTNSTNLQIIKNDSIIICVSSLDFILFWKFLSVDGVLEPKRFCPHWGSNSRPRVQHSNVLSQGFTTQLSRHPWLINYLNTSWLFARRISMTQKYIFATSCISTT